MISPFEYITVLISIILGMGLTQLVSGFAAAVIRWEKVKVYWPHTILVVLVFIIHIQDWFATYELRTFKAWHLPVFLFIILYPVNLYVLTRILFPVRWSAKETDLKIFYFANFRKIYFFMMLLPLHSIIDNHFIGDYAFKDQPLQIAFFLILATMVFYKNCKEWMHKSVAILFLVITIITFIAGWNVFLIA